MQFVSQARAHLYFWELVWYFLLCTEHIAYVRVHREKDGCFDAKCTSPEVPRREQRNNIRYWSEGWNRAQCLLLACIRKDAVSEGRQRIGFAFTQNCFEYSPHFNSSWWRSRHLINLNTECSLISTFTYYWSQYTLIKNINIQSMILSIFKHQWHQYSLLTSSFSFIFDLSFYSIMTMLFVRNCNECSFSLSQRFLKNPLERHSHKYQSSGGVGSSFPWGKGVADVVAS